MASVAASSRSNTSPEFKGISAWQGTSACHSGATTADAVFQMVANELFGFRVLS